LGGDNRPQNLIRLSPEEHLFAHLLLAKIHGGQLAVCVIRMLGMKRYAGRKSRLEYAALRALHAEATSKNQKGRPKPEGHGELMRVINRDPTIIARVHTPESDRRRGDFHRGKPKPQSQREKMKASWDIPEVRAARTAWLATQVQSAATRAKRSATLKRLGGPSPETILKMRKPKSEAGKLNMKRAALARHARERAARESVNAFS
jgi:hypothetical protein